MTKRSDQRRNSTGRTVGRPFAKGQSGNPGGRPKLPAELRERAQAVTADMLDTLIALAKDTGQPGHVRVSAANSVLDRGHGKPTVSVDVRPRHSLADFTTAELMALAAAAMEEHALLVEDTASEWPN